jgi:predicted AAA+ superfamily ATPase
MALPSWWQVATPHKDIREGKMSEAVFAADLGDVVSGKAPLEYSDPVTFFQRTFLTQGLKKLLENVLYRLENGKGDPVIQLQTPFGGGKTHALLALYHAIKNRDKINHLDIFSNLPNPKNAKIAVFVGTQADPLKGKTPWGEIAYQLGMYDKVKEHDEKRRSPGKKILSEILGDHPVLILIDELVEYTVKAKDFYDQISAFSHEITELVRSKEYACLVCTLPSSAPYGETGERALTELQKIYGRVETVYTPVEGIEIYEVVRKRLFEDIGDENIRKKVAQNYFDMYQKLGTDIPPEVKEITYREQIEHAYPFHPELIDVLYERWGSIPTFQRTRGVLRLLAEIVADLYKRKIPSPLIQSSLVNLENQTIRREFIKHIGNEYEAVIASDIAGLNAKAPKIDKEMGSEYEKYNIATGIATTVFLYSFSGSERKGTNLPRIKIAVLREGIPHTIVGDAIGKLEEELWYFHSEKKQYSFRNQPNLNRVIVDREETISEAKIQEELKNLLSKNAGRNFETYLWPQGPSDIPDNKNLKLAIFSPDYPCDSEKGKKLAEELFEKSGTSFRVYKNTLFVIAMEKSQYPILSKSLKRYLALKEIQNDRDLLENLTKETQEELRKKIKEAENDLPSKILTAYRFLALIEDKGISWKDLGIPTVGTNLLSERVKGFLIDQEKILTQLTPKYIIEKMFAKDEDEKTLREIYELFLKIPGMPIPASEDVIINAVREGVKIGKLGIKDDSKVFFKQDVSPSTDSIVIRPELAKILTGETKEPETPPMPSSPPTIVGEQPPVTKDKPKKLTLKAKVPWDKLSDIIKGVIAPLKDKADSIDITIEIQAESKEGFDKNTLEIKVKETLKQISAQIQNWSED